MKIICFKEGEKFYGNQLNVFLHNNGIDQLNEVIDKLVLANIIKQRFLYNDLDQNQYEYDQLDLKNNNKKEQYIINYVGILTLSNILIICYPKYIYNIQHDFEGNKEKIIQILRVIGKFQKVNLLDHFSKYNSTCLFSNIFSIIQDYQFNGLYVKERAKICLNNNGQILWDKTILECPTYILNDNPYYFDLYTEDSQNEDDYIIRKIHLAILNEIFEFLEPVLDIFDLENNIVTSEKLLDIGNLDYLISIIERELTLEFATSKQLLLNNLLLYLNKETIVNDSTIVRLFGTSSFNLVWEEVCKKVYSNDLEKPLSTLDIKLSCNEKKINYEGDDYFLLKDIIDKPVWKRDNPYSYISSNKTLSLDVLSINRKDSLLEIYDAKYYCIQFSDDGSKIYDNPGVSDLTKQYLYQLAYKDIAEINNFKFLNYFIVPMDSDYNDLEDNIILATAEIQMMKNLGLEDIKIIQRNCIRIFNEYLSMQ